MTKFSDWHKRAVPYIVWIFRIIVGATFIFSGASKSIDPWGFIYKIEEYLQVWGIEGVSRELMLCTALGLSIAEFTTGVLIAGGCLRRVAVWAAGAFMAVMLPLTAWIMIADPVADCGCFGDALVISNTATFLKNIVLAIMIAYLLKHNRQAPCLFLPLSQWMIAAASIIYCLTVGLVGYLVQPVVDFRPYPTGTDLAISADASEIKLIYTKNGRQKFFSTDSLPDDTWEYVGRAANDETPANNINLAIFDGDDDVTASVIEPEGEQMLLLVANPDFHGRARSGMANRIARLMSDRGGSMIAVVATHPDSIAAWAEKVHPEYDVYTSEDTSLKEIARGDASLVFLNDGIIQWKRNIYSLPGDFPDNSPEAFTEVYSVDSGTFAWTVSLCYILVLILVFCIRLLKHKKSA